MKFEQALDNYFQITLSLSSIRTELMAGVKTFLTMAYIMFFYPQLLSTTGMDAGSVFTATCLVTATGCLLSAFLSNTPVTIAPGMALNTVFAFIVVQAEGYSWQNTLGMVFISGIIFMFLTISQIRTIIIIHYQKL